MKVLFNAAFFLFSWKMPIVQSEGIKAQTRCLPCFERLVGEMKPVKTWGSLSSEEILTSFAYEGMRKVMFYLPYGFL